MKRVLCLMVTAAAILPNSARATCAGLIDTTTAVVSGRQYDPFSATPVADTYTVRITSKASKACNFALVFSALPGPRQLGGTLSYTLTNLNGHSLIVAEPPADEPGSSLSTSNLGANATADLSFLIKMARGQFAAPALYADSITIRLYAVEDGRYQLHDTKPLSFSYTVPQILSVTVGNAAPGGAMQFGELVQGAQRSVAIQARSNVSYRFNVSSDNRGVLLLDPPVSTQAWSVPFAAAVDGYAVDLSGPVGSTTVLAPATPIGGDNHVLAVTIGDVSKRRAGIYRDVITVKILAEQP
jgi:hypothetical protein